MRGAAFVLVSLIVAFLSVFTTLVLPTTIGAVKCTSTSAQGEFLAYCANTKFADYEHGAYYLRGLEPEAIASLERAQVVILGSSLAQFSFSTTATKAYFTDRKLRFYLAGFGYVEGGRFASLVLSRLSVHPTLYIVHAYNFFSPHLSPAAAAAITKDAILQFYAKKAGAIAASWICSMQLKWCGTDRSIYRDRRTGSWNLSNAFGNLTPRPIPPTRPMHPAPVPDELARAADFAASVGVPPECIVVTATPTENIDYQDYVQLIAEHIHAVALVPELEGLTTIDGLHFDHPSAERWSKDFFDHLDRVADRCAAFSDHR